MSKRPYDSTVARIAGNLLSGAVVDSFIDDAKLAELAVRLARAIVAETKKTEPEQEPS